MFGHPTGFAERFNVAQALLAALSSGDRHCASPFESYEDAVEGVIIVFVGIGSSL